MTRATLEGRVVNYLTLAACFAGLLIGVAAMAASSKIDWFNTHPNVAAVTREVGALVFATALLAIFWELLAKRSFGDEILAKVGISNELIRAGVRSITANFHRDVQWDEHFRRARELDIFFAYGGTWRSTHTEQLQHLVRREGARLRLILPDHEDKTTVADLARRFSYSVATVANKIKESEKSFQALAVADGCRAHIEIWLSTRTPVFSSYRFDDVCIAALYHHKKDRGWVPAFTIVKGGSLYEFFSGDFEAMIDPKIGTARQVFSNGAS